MADSFTADEHPRSSDGRFRPAGRPPRVQAAAGLRAQASAPPGDPALYAASADVCDGGELDRSWRGERVVAAVVADHVPGSDVLRSSLRQPADVEVAALEPSAAGGPPRVAVTVRRGGGACVVHVGLTSEAAATLADGAKLALVHSPSGDTVVFGGAGVPDGVARWAASHRG